jgi:hypothetical protein
MWRVDTSGVSARLSQESYSDASGVPWSSRDCFWKS